MSAGRVIIGVIGDDIHVVGNRIMELALSEAGFEVFNLRTRNRPESFQQAALEVNADAVLVSSLNGEGEYWCTNFRRYFVEIGMAGIVLYVGGSLVVGNRNEREVVEAFRQQGFDRVFYQQPDIGVAIAELQKDLRNGEARSDRQPA